MLSEIAAWLFALFVLDPLEAEMRQRIEKTSMPVEAIEQSRQCIATHGPRLLERAGQEPGWAVSTAIGVATGWTPPVGLFDARDPNCSVFARLLKAGSDQSVEG